MIDGAARDAHELAACKIGILARALIPMKTEKRGLGVRGATIAIAGAVIQSGDWLYADRDGVVAADGKLHD